MENKNFVIGDLLGYGWRVTTSNLGFFIGLGFIFWPINYLPSVLQVVLDRADIDQPLYAILYFLIMIMSYLVSFALAIGITKISLSFIDGSKPSISKLFDFSDCFWRYLGVQFLYMLIILGGFLLFIIPGIIWSIQFMLAPYYVVDKGLGPIEALKASSRTTKGVKFDLFGLTIIGSLIMLAGILCLVVGVFVTYPLTILAYVLVYRQLLAQTPELAEFGIGLVAVAEHVVEEQVLEDRPVNDNMQ
jgi:uncharacterized membrane protein